MEANHKIFVRDEKNLLNEILLYNKYFIIEISLKILQFFL